MHTYEIRGQGQLGQRWPAWFNGLAISYAASGNTVLRGSLVDEAALHGVLSKVRESSLTSAQSRAESKPMLRGTSDPKGLSNTQLG